MVTPAPQDEKKFFLYLNMLDQISQAYPRLKHLLSTLKDGFQSTIRNIVAHKVDEKAKIMQKDGKIEQQQNLTDLQKQIDDRKLIIEEQEDIIENKDGALQKMKNKITSQSEDNKKLQTILEKHRINGIQLQDENELLKLEIERLRKIEEDILDKCDVLESTDQDMAQALKDIRDQEYYAQQQNLSKHSKNIPKLNLEKVQEIMLAKWNESNISYNEGESEYESNSDPLQYQIQQYYSQRKSDDLEGSESEVSNYKDNIRLLLQSSITKPLNIEAEVSEQSKLFDYEPKREDSIEAFEDQQTSKQVPVMEQDEVSEPSEVLKNDQYALYDDSSSSCESYYSQEIGQAIGGQPVVPMLNLGGGAKPEAMPIPMLNLGSVADPKMTVHPIQIPPEQPKPEVNVTPTQLNTVKKGKKITLENIKQKDFQDEFMEKFDEFSDSWRQLIEKEKRF